MAPPADASAASGPARRRPRWLAGAALVLLALAAAAWPAARWVRIGAEGWLYGYPLVMMDLTRETAVQTVGPPNRLQRVRRFPDPSFRDVVRPNVDTLYTSAFLDMDDGPFVFEMPPNAERYELMPFMDAWTNVFASPGTRTTGTGGGRYLLAGPRWQGVVPGGLTLLRAPTRIVWLIGRTEADGEADFARVHRLQDGLRLRPLADWQAGRDPPAAAWAPAAVRPLPPVQQMQAMPIEDFFARLARLMADNPPAAADAPMLAQLARIGVAPGQPPQWQAWQREAVALGRRLAERRIAEELARPRAAAGGWVTPPATLGAYGTDYALRAVVAMVGLGANLPADATYPNTRVDGEGRPLDGSRRYRLHFAPGTLPPVHAFWSITAYGADDFLIAHPAQRHAVGSRAPLHFHADGSLDLAIQADPPADLPAANWLPVRAGEPFLLNARLYWPKPEALDGRWQLPPVRRLP